MTESPHAGRGTIVTYLDASDSPHGWFSRGVVTGVGVLDPETDLDWLPVVRPDGELVLLDPALIVTTEQGRAETEPLPALDILAGALAALADGMSELDERAPMALGDAQRLLARFVEVITPIEYALCVLVDADPRGELALVLSCISSAAEEFEHGHVADGKAGILIANHAMAGVAGPESDGPWDDMP
jgi:hypothetical protein